MSCLIVNRLKQWLWEVLTPEIFHSPYWVLILKPNDSIHVYVADHFSSWGKEGSEKEGMVENWKELQEKSREKK